MNKLLLTIATLFVYSGLFAQRTTLPNTANQSPSNYNLKNLNGQQIQGRLVVNDTAWLNGNQVLIPNGNVGIGTIAPNAKLEVVGVVFTTDSVGSGANDYWEYIMGNFGGTNRFSALNRNSEAGIFAADSTGNMKSKAFGVINGMSYDSRDSTDISCEIGQRLVSGAHTGQIEFHTNAATGVGHIHFDVRDSAANAIRLHLATADSSIDLTTNGTEISITASDSLKYQAGIIYNTGQVFNIGAGTFITNNGTSEGRLFFVEDTDNGTNTIRLGSPAALAASINLTLPPTDGDVGDVLRSNGAGVMTWIPPTWIDISTSPADSIISWTTYDGESIIIEKDFEDFKIHTNDNSEGISVGNVNRANFYVDNLNQITTISAGTTSSAAILNVGTSKSLLFYTKDSLGLHIDSTSTSYFGGNILPDDSAAVNIGSATKPFNTIYTELITSDVTNPPTDAEIDAIYGTPATVGRSFTGKIKDSNSNNLYMVIAVGAEWYTFSATLAP